MPYLKAGLTVERLRISFSHPVLASLAVRKVSHVFHKEFTQPRISKFHGCVHCIGNEESFLCHCYVLVKRDLMRTDGINAVGV